MLKSHPNSHSLPELKVPKKLSMKRNELKAQSRVLIFFSWIKHFQLKFQIRDIMYNPFHKNF